MSNKVIKFANKNIYIYKIMKKIFLILISCCISVCYSYAQQTETEPEFLYEGLLIQDGDETSAAATEAHFETYMDWGHDQRYAVRIKEIGKYGSVPVKKDTPSKLIIRIGFNNVSPAQVFSIIPFKQKKKQRNIDFIGFYREHSVNSEADATARTNITQSNLSGTNNVNGNASLNATQRISYTNLPDYEDRFPQSIVKLSGKKLGKESYILNLPALAVGEYAICFKDAEGVIMIIDLSVQ